MIEKSDQLQQFSTVGGSKLYYNTFPQQKKKGASLCMYLRPTHIIKVVLQGIPVDLPYDSDSCIYVWFGLIPIAMDQVWRFLWAHTVVYALF